MITYLRMSSAWHKTHATVAGGQPFIGRRRIWPRLPPRPGRNLGRPGEVRAAGIDIDRGTGHPDPWQYAFPGFNASPEFYQMFRLMVLRSSVVGVVIKEDRC
jgi:hypothetical protein